MGGTTGFCTCTCASGYSGTNCDQKNSASNADIGHSPSSGPSPSAEELGTDGLLQSGGVKPSTASSCLWLGLYLAACLLFGAF